MSTSMMEELRRGEKTTGFPYLHIPQKLRQVEMPFLHEVGKLKDEPHSVICLLKAGQTLYCPDSIQALER